MAARVLIVDDHGVIRAGLSTLLDRSSEVEVVGAAANAAEAIEMVRRLRPDLALVDIHMPDKDGITVTRELKAENPSLKVLILTAHEEPGLVREALKAGANGYVVKRAVATELFDAIQAAMRGDMYLHPSMVRAFLDPVPATRGADQSESPGLLTPRETEVLQLIAAGHTNHQIADILIVSPRTIESHRANILGKLKLRNRAELVRYAMEHRLFANPSSSPQASSQASAPSRRRSPSI